MIGLCCADALLRRGFKVTVLERDPQPGEGCSYGNGGLVVPSHFEPLASPGMVSTGLKMLLSRESPFGFSGIPNLEMASWMARFALAGTETHVERCAPVLRDLNLQSRSLFEDRFADLSFGYGRKGELMICGSAKTLEGEARLARKAKALGLGTTVLNRQELASFEKGIEIDADGAVYFEDDGQLTPPLFMMGLRAQLLSSGVEIFDNLRVEGFGWKDGTISSAHGGGRDFSGDEFVLAAGAWSGVLARKLNLKLPLLGGKGYGFTVVKPPAMPSYPAILVDGRVAVTPMETGLHFVGTMELGLPQAPQVNPQRLAGMRKAIADAYPAFRSFDLTTIRAWAGLRPCSPDGMPYLGRPEQFKNLTIATGHAMMGMSLGPISGELIAQVVAGSATSVPLDLLSPNRFS